MEKTKHAKGEDRTTFNGDYATNRVVWGLWAVDDFFVNIFDCFLY